MLSLKLTYSCFIDTFQLFFSLLFVLFNSLTQLSILSCKLLNFNVMLYLMVHKPCYLIFFEFQLILKSSYFFLSFASLSQRKFLKKLYILCFELHDGQMMFLFKFLVSPF